MLNLNGTASNPIVFMDEFPLRGKETHDSFKVVYYHLYARLRIVTSPQGFSLNQMEVKSLGRGLRGSVTEVTFFLCASCVNIF